MASSRTASGKGGVRHEIRRFSASYAAPSSRSVRSGHGWPVNPFRQAAVSAGLARTEERSGGLA
jgi:hypothetical protein